MFQHTFRRLCVLVVLALSLALAVPGRADAAPSGPAGLWRWLENFLPERLVLLVRSEQPAPARRGASSGSLEKNCTGADPNGVCTSGGGGGTNSSGGG